MGPLCVPELTFRLLEPVLANFKGVLQCCCINSLGTKKCFAIFFFVSQQELCSFLQGVDWCHILISTKRESRAVEECQWVVDKEHVV